MSLFNHHSEAEREQLFAVPVAARPFPIDGTPSKQIYHFYVIVFADTAEAATKIASRELRDEKLEFIQCTGKILSTNLAAWNVFVGQNFSWIEADLPTAAALADAPRGIVYYTPKIVQL